ncbi:hypothetical protein ACFSTH_10215 [Paenibacillus yanchengensis]|uniref:Lipoprotein n=1 Tax=Paenibacillus yanchengensis TaxID=2035833 RepID=A0ABW4YNW7_9BACL
MKNASILLYGLVFLLISTFIVSGCTKVKENNELIIQNDLKQQLITMAEIEVYSFENFPWSVNKQAVIDQLKNETIQSNETNRIIVASDLLSNSNMQQQVIYNFEEEQLISGEYWFITTDDNQFNSLLETMNLLLSEHFPSPKSDNLEKLEHAIRSGASDVNIMWQGSDNSYFYVKIGTTEQNKKVLQIHITSPRSEQNSLKKD